MYSSSDSEVSDSFVNGLLNYASDDDINESPAAPAPSPAATSLPPTADQPPHHQVAPDRIQETPQKLPAASIPPPPPPPTDHELAHPPHQNAPDQIHEDASDETHTLHASNPPPPPPPPPSSTTDEPDAHPPHQNAPINDQLMIKQEEPADSTEIPAVFTSSLLITTSEHDHHHHHPPPPSHSHQDEYYSKAVNTTPPPPTDQPHHHNVVDMGSDSESADDSDEIQILDSFPTDSTSTDDQFVESTLLFPDPISWIHPMSGLLFQYHHGGVSTDGRHMLPASRQPPQPSLQLQLALALHHLSSQCSTSHALANRDRREPQRPDWLPENWRMECTTRNSGTSAGNRDKYFIEPGRGRKFRSKREVLYFLETGERIQNKRKMNATAMPSDISGPSEGTSSSSTRNLWIESYQEEGSTSQQKLEETTNLDSDDVPAKQNEETPPNVDSDQNPPKRPRGSPSK